MYGTTRICKIFSRRTGLPSALKVPLPSITLAHHPEEHGTASTPFMVLLSKFVMKGLDPEREFVAVDSLAKGFHEVVADVLLSSGLRQSPNSPLERHLKHRFTAPVES